MELSVSAAQMRMVGNMPNNPESHHFAVSKEHMGLVEPMPSNPGINTLTIPNNRVGSYESPGGGMGSSTIWTSNQLGREDAVILNNMMGPGTSFPVKRKAEMGSMSNNTISQAQSALSKKMVRNDSISGRSGLQHGQQPAKRQTTQSVSASKSRPEPSEAVRSKMRESLAAALALASRKLDNVSKTEKDETDATITHQMPTDTKTSESNTIMGANVSRSGSEEVFPSKESAVVGTAVDPQVLSTELPPNQSSSNGGHAFQQFQYSSILPDEDDQFSDSFFVKDDLLQGNGLSWAFDLDVRMREGEEARNDNAHSERGEVEGPSDTGEKAILTSEKLALNIEAELFKLYGGVNKKYKEKGRSLLFNLKDRNNPELRERVMSGEISPERLCSMSAEELASKELSQWRMAKAEEFAQMVVLPDTEVDIRRLVKKTHKGEYQVEFERDDGVVEEVYGGTSMLTQARQEKETKTLSPPKVGEKDEENVAGRGNILENQDFSGGLIIPTDGTDLMQGMMVDELKDAPLLPPIVSLDEFMESLNSEPPFENLSADAVQKTQTPHVETPKDRASDSPKDASSKKADVVKKHEVGTALKSSGRREQKGLPNVEEIGYIWEGILQLNTSSSVIVRGLFQSGEKTSTKEWSTSLEIKGRVRVDAFEKYLQELPLSRTRAVMVLHFVLKDKSSKNQLSSLSEAVDSYAADQRLGYAQAAPGVEIYLCPPTPRISEMLNKHMPKERLKSNNSIQDGLIGVVIWRRAAHISNTITSPKSSKNHKPTSKKQPFSAPNSVNTPTRSPASVFNNVSRSKPKPEDDDDGDDDVPPGFGHVAAARAAKDEDDLPEFSFSGDLNPPLPRVPPQDLHHGVKMTESPVDHVRELIKKYGQTGADATSRSGLDKSWNDDDDDDMPEWLPEVPHQLHHLQFPAVRGHQPPPVHLLPTNRHITPAVVNLRSPGGLMPPSPSGRWGQSPPRPLHGARWRPY